MSEAKPPPPKMNPAFRAMGLPNIRAKLPSRNWTIFLSVVTAFTATLYYDRHQTKLTKRRYSELVSHLALEPLSPQDLPRKVTVYLISPPGDGLSPAREHFRDYVKPILNAAALDFDVVEGREMGELRAKVASGVRRRRAEGLGNMGLQVPGPDGGEGGVVCVGRQAWKEWIRGVQEGWLGPLEEPAPPVTEKVEELVGELADKAKAAKEVVVETLDQAVSSTDEEKLTAADEEKKKAAEKPPKPAFPKEYISPADYHSARLPADTPEILPPAGVVPFPHILGFKNTHTRFYRFLHRREMAEAVCREAAAVALGHYRPFIQTRPSPDGVLKAEGQLEATLEQQEHEHEQDHATETEIDGALKHEEKEWIGAVWKEDRYKGVWTEPMGVDDRIRQRLRKFYLPTEEMVKVQKAKEEEDFFGRRKKPEDAAAEKQD